MDLLVNLKKGDYKPLYLLHGDEPYYIDKVSKFIEQHGLEEHERDFNLNIFYGRDLKKDDLLETVRRFPMMAQRQVVIVREAQDFSGKWTDLEDYFLNPMPSTVLVIDHKYKTADAKTKWFKAIKKNGAVLHSSKHYDNELPEVISGFVRAMKYRIHPNAAHLMAEYLGNDLEKIEMELGKLAITVPLSKEISVDDIHRLIGVSKEYNVFEYLNALSSRDEFRSFKVAQFLGKNEKNNPFILIISTLFAHFSKVMIYHSLKSKDLNSVASALGMRNTYAARSVLESGRHFTFAQVAQIISLLREFDARNKGVNSSYSESSEEMLKELTFRILN